MPNPTASSSHSIPDPQDFPLWIRVPFAYSGLSPLFWIISVCVALILNGLSLIDLIAPSYPYWLLVLSFLGGAGLTYFFYQRTYPELAQMGQGGFLPSVQRVLISIGTLEIFCLALLLIGRKHYILGLALLLPAAFYLLRFPRQQRRKGALSAFMDLINTTERLKLPGIQRLEAISLWLTLSCLLLSVGSTLDMWIPTGFPDYQVQVRSKEVRKGSKGSRSYIVHLKGWKQQASVEIRLSRVEWERTDIADFYRLQTRRGLLGGERLHKFKPDYEAMRNGS